MLSSNSPQKGGRLLSNLSRRPPSPPGDPDAPSYNRSMQNRPQNFSTNKQYDDGRNRWKFVFTLHYMEAFELKWVTPMVFNTGLTHLGLGSQYGGSQYGGFNLYIYFLKYYQILLPILFFTLHSLILFFYNLLSIFCLVGWDDKIIVLIKQLWKCQ